MSIRHGLLLIDKPMGVTSHDVVAKVRKFLNQKEVGHSGTLDPMASGLMVLLLGEATKLSQYILDGDKTYHLQLRLGVTTDTLDSTGQVLEEKPVHSSKEDVLKLAGQLVGEIELSVPIFSAVKVDGKRLYNYAREGGEVTPPKKIMKFWDVQTLGDQVFPDQASAQYSFALSCSKGGYVRAWVNHLGQGLGCGACMTALRRTKSVPFKVENAITLEALAADPSVAMFPEALIPMESSLHNAKRLRIRGHDLVLMRNGQIGNELKTQLIRAFNPQSDELVQIISAEDGKLVSLIGLIPTKGFTIRRVFKY